MTVESKRGEVLFAKSELADGISPGGDGAHRLTLSALILLELTVELRVECPEGIAAYEKSADSTGAWRAAGVSVGGRGKGRTRLENVLKLAEGLSSSSIGDRQRVRVTTTQRVGDGPEHDDVDVDHAFDILW